TNAIPGAANQGNSAQESFQDRLRRAYSERSRVVLRPKRPCAVVRVAVKPGDQVKTGQDLVFLDDRESRIRLRAAESEYDIAEADHALKKKELESALKFQLTQNRGASDDYKKSQDQD